MKSSVASPKAGSAPLIFIQNALWNSLEFTAARNANPKHEPMVDLILTLRFSPNILFSPN